MNPELNSLIAAARSVAADAKTFFGDLNVEQLNWKPNANAWSVGQCLEHLIVTNEKLLTSAESHIKGIHQKTFFERLPYLPEFFGAQILKATQPENRRKVKAPRVFRPASSSVASDVIDRFVRGQEEVINLMQASANLDLERTIITSPVARFVTYSLFDAFKIVVFHERRHFRQAQNVIKLADFPN